MLAGLFIGSLFLVRLGDIYGRKKVLAISTLFSSVALAGLLIVNNMTLLYVFIFLFGLSGAPRYAIGYVYALELTTTNHEALYNMIAMVFDSFSLIILGTYFYFFKSMWPLIWVLNFV